IRAPGCAAHAAFTAHSLQPAAHHPGADRLGPGHGTVHGCPTRRPAAAAAECGGARFLAVDGRAAFRAVVPRAAAEAICRSTHHLDGVPALWVPSLILQPLIENAVVHGLAGHNGAVEIRVEVSVCGENLVLRVINTIAPNSIVGRDGIGLRNVRERLAVQFAERATFTAEAAGAGDWIAQIRMPLLRDGPELAAA